VFPAGGTPGRRDDVIGRGTPRRRAGGVDVATVRQPVLALPLHPAVLEPDLDLPFGEAEGVRDFDPPATGQVPVEVELLLEFEGLVARVGGSRSLRVVVGGRRQR